MTVDLVDVIVLGQLISDKLSKNLYLTLNTLLSLKGGQILSQNKCKHCIKIFK